jgi:hypothetical protein
MRTSMGRGIAGRISGGVPQINSGYPEEELGNDRPVLVKVRRRFDPLSPLAGLGSAAAYSASDASVDVQQEQMGSWLSKALGGGNVISTIANVVGSVIPGASAVTGIIANAAGGGQQTGPAATTPQPAVTQPPAFYAPQQQPGNTVIVVPDEEKKDELPKWAIPAAVALLIGITLAKK